MDDEDAIVRRARHLRERGDFSASVGLLEERISEDEVPDVRLISELGETLLSQGCISKAVAVLKKGVPLSGNTNDAYAALCRILYDFARFQATGQYQEGIVTSSIICQTFLLSAETRSYDDALVRLEVYHLKFLSHITQHGHEVVSNDLYRSLDRLKSAFNTFLRRDDLYHSMVVARSYFYCSPESDPILLNQLTEPRVNLPQLYRAEIYCILAQQLKQINQRDEQDRLWATALDILKEEPHRHRSLDIKIKTECRFPLDVDGPPFDEVILPLLGEYEKLQYPAGLVFAYLEFSALASQCFAPDVETAVLTEIEKICNSCGMGLVSMIARLSIFARASATGQHPSRVIQGCSALWHELVDTDCAVLRGQAAMLVAQAYYAIDDTIRAKSWWNTAERDPKGIGPFAVPSYARDAQRRDEDWLRWKYEAEMSICQREIANGKVLPAIQKLQNFVNNVLDIPISTGGYFEILDGALNVAEQNLEKLGDCESTRNLRAHLRQSQASVLLRKATPRDDVELEMQSIAASNEAKTLYLRDNQTGHAATVLQHQGLVYIGVFQKFERWRDPQAKDVLMTALGLYRVARDSASGLGLTFLAREMAYWVAYCQYAQFQRGWEESAAVVESLLLAEDYVDKRRQETSIFHKIEAISSKRRLSSNDHTRKIYSFAIDVFRRRDEMKQAWHWLQKSKARSLSDILGIGVLLPQALIQRINADAAAQKLFDEEQKLLQSLELAPDTSIFQLRGQLDAHRVQMNNYESLRELIDLRVGAPVNLRQLCALPKIENNGGKNLVFVDWLVTPNGIIQMCVTKAPGDVAFRTLRITGDHVKKWISKYLNSTDNGSSDEGDAALKGLRMEDEETTGPLRELDNLIAPLGELSNPDDLLVFCPSNILHAIPLHALRLSGKSEEEILIFRNPVVYCASLTSFFQSCQQAAERNSRDSSSETGRFLSVYEPAPPSQDISEEGFTVEDQQEAYTSIHQISEDFGAKSLTGADVSSESVKESLESCNLVHFLGHCGLDSVNVEDQFLQLSVGGSRAKITVKDIFDFNIKASHVSLLACGSAFQHFEAGDEPLGLITALLSAGASSVLGTLWPVQLDTASKFSKHFYGYLKDYRNSSSIYNLANAVREAILDVKQEFELRNPYHWASFVLHGAWFLGASNPKSRRT